MVFSDRQAHKYLLLLSQLQPTFLSLSRAKSYRIQRKKASRNKNLSNRKQRVLFYIIHAVRLMSFRLWRQGHSNMKLTVQHDSAHDSRQHLIHFIILHNTDS